VRNTDVHFLPLLYSTFPLLHSPYTVVKVFHHSNIFGYVWTTHTLADSAGTCKCLTVSVAEMLLQQDTGQ